jgi:hypothetical protein
MQQLIKSSTLILLLIISTSSCKKQPKSFKVAISNKTPFALNQVKVACGKEPIIYTVGANSTTPDQTLQNGGRELFSEVNIVMSIDKYTKDSLEFIYNKGGLGNRADLKEDQSNIINIVLDSTKLPEVLFLFLVNR